MEKIKKLFFHNQGTKQILFKNTFWLLAAEVVSKLLLFIITISIVRYLGTELYGKYSFAVAFASLFGVIVDFGLGTMLVQELASNDKKNSSLLFGSILSLKLILGVIAYSAVVIVAHYLHLPQDVLRLVYLSGIYMLIQSFVLFFPSLFQAYEKMQFSFIVRTGSNMLLCTFVLLAIFLKLSAAGIFYAYILTAFLMFVLALLLVRKYFFPIIFKISKESINYLLKRSWFLFFGGVFMILYVYTDTTMISLLRNYREVGLYQSAYNILYGFLALNLIHVSLFPRMAEMYRTNKVGLRKLLTFLIILSLIVAIPTIVIIGLFRNQIIHIIYGTRFTGAGDIMLLLLIGGTINYFTGFVSNLLLIKRKEKLWFIAFLVGYITNISTNYFLIPKFGPIGAGISYIVGYMVLLTSLVIFAKYC